MGIIFDITIVGIMRLYSWIEGRYVYIDAPEWVISDRRKGYLIRLYHFMPTVVLSILFIIKILPKISTSVERDLSDNSPIIWVYFLIAYFLHGIVIGLIIENYLAFTNQEYRNFKSMKVR